MLPLSQTVPLDEKMDLHKFTLRRKNAKLKRFGIDANQKTRGVNK